MNATRAPSTLLALALAAAVAVPAAADGTPPLEPDDSPGVVVGRIGRCFASLLYDFGIGGFVIQYGACSIYIPVAADAEAP